MHLIWRLDVDVYSVLTRVCVCDTFLNVTTTRLKLLHGYPEARSPTVTLQTLEFAQPY